MSRWDGKAGVGAYHMLKWVMYSLSVIPLFPTSSMSRSFHAPGLLLYTTEAALLRIFMMEQWKPGGEQS